MAMAAAFRLLRRNTCWKMHPTISQFNKTSLSPSLPPPSFLCSFPLIPSLWCSPPLRSEYQTTILKCDQFREYNDRLFEKRGKIHYLDQEESDPNERGKKRPRRPEGEDKKWEDGGETEESGDASAVMVGLDLDLEIMGDGEYVLKTKRTITQGSEGTTTEVERAKQMAQNATMIRELLQEMEEKLLDQSRASPIRSISVRKSV